MSDLHSQQPDPSTNTPSIHSIACPNLHDNTSGTKDIKIDSRAPPGKKNVASEVSSTSTSLASLLAESYKEIDSLRHELSVIRSHAEKAEQLSSSLQSLYSATSPDVSKSDTPSDGPSTSAPPTTLSRSAVVILMDFENRAVRAEVARDEAEAKIRMYKENWIKLDSQLSDLLDAFSAASAKHGRILSGSDQEGGENRESPLSIYHHVSNIQ